MKIDLDELERKARAALGDQDDWDTVAAHGALIGGPAYAHAEANRPPVTLALIAHIRELRAEVERAAVLLEVHTDAAARRSWAADLRATVTKGAVLP